MEASAPVSGMAAVANAYNASAGDMVAQLTGLITGLLPVLLPLLGIMIAVGFGIRIIRKITGSTR